MTIATQSLGDIVATNPAAAATFERLGLDYCCRGERSLAAACTDAGLDPEAVVADLAALAVSGDRSWADLDPPALADHIVGSHHRYLKEELPLLDALAGKVLAVHGDNHPELADVRTLVCDLRADLIPHLMKEERVLFPAIHDLAGGPRPFPFGPLSNPIRMMLLEHDRAGDLLAALRAATGNYTVPADGCASYRSLYERLEALEADTHVHIHKENHTLFPAALRLAGE
ncbi:MAG TPA: iron-sulfur cluster repair di-iron protein [Acidimicrobiia bacterium]|nr:iron-sulfur cluster repair di-iron protein [Acidimicrobiia bacterium]